MAAVPRTNTTQDHTPEFKQALTRLTLRNDAVFFIAMLYSMRHERYDPFIVRGQRTIAATDGVRIAYDGELFSKDSLEDRQYTLVHEILHIVLYHPLRRGIRDPHIWNIACDYVVNGMIHEQGAFKIPATDIQPDPAFTGKSAEQVYDMLMKEAEQALSGGKSKGKGQGGRTWVRADPQDGDGEPGEGEGEGQGDGEPGEGEGEGQGDGEPGDGQGNASGSPQLQGKNPNDVQDYKPEANEGKSAAQAERDIGISTEKALQSAKAAGQGSKLMKEFLNDAQVRKEPWYGHLRRYMTALYERTYNWSHFNRRRAVLFNVVAPDMRSESMGKLVVSIDESASLSTPQLAAISAHCLDIFREVRPKSVVVLRHTDDVTDEEIFEGPDYEGFKLIRKSTGGTDFRPVFEHVHANHGDTQVILMFTDMYGPFPPDPSIDTIWVTSTPESSVATPFGDRIAADFND